MNLLLAKKILEREPSHAELPLVLKNYGNTGAAGVVLAFLNHRIWIQDLGECFVLLALDIQLAQFCYKNAEAEVLAMSRFNNRKRKILDK